MKIRYTNKAKLSNLNNSALAKMGPDLFLKTCVNWQNIQKLYLQRKFIYYYIMHIPYLRIQQIIKDCLIRACALVGGRAVGRIHLYCI